MEQNHPSDNLQMPWPTCGLGLQKKRKRPKKGNFKGRKNGPNLVWFERIRHNYLDYENSHGNIEVASTIQFIKGMTSLILSPWKCPRVAPASSC
ncbi:MAG: hypothetical protein ACLUIO_24370 [Neglectibacter timonensis]